MTIVQCISVICRNIITCTSKPIDIDVVRRTVGQWDTTLYLMHLMRVNNMALACFRIMNLKSYELVTRWVLTSWFVEFHVIRNAFQSHYYSCLKTTAWNESDVKTCKSEFTFTGICSYLIIFLLSEESILVLRAIPHVCTIWQYHFYFYSLWLEMQSRALRGLAEIKKSMTTMNFGMLFLIAGHHVGSARTLTRQVALTSGT